MKQRTFQIFTAAWTLVLAIALVGLAVMLVSLPGCGAIELPGVTERQPQAPQTTITDTTSATGTSEPGRPHQRVAQAVGDVAGAVAKQPDAADAVEVGTAAAAPFFGPWGGVVMGAGGLLAGLLRARQERQAARQIARSVEPIVAAQIKSKPATAAELRSKQGRLARKIIDEAQGR